MQIEQISTEQLLLEIQTLRQEVKDLKRDKADLQILLEAIATQADSTEVQLPKPNKQLQGKTVERQCAEAVQQAFAAQLQSILEIVTREKGRVSSNGTEMYVKPTRQKPSRRMFDDNSGLTPALMNLTHGNRLTV